MHAFTQPFRGRAALSTIAARVAPFALPLLTGLALLWLAGAAPYPAVHDALHDVRHVAGFPCH
ncbi:MAG: CbtB-domain containing protein [Nitrospirota bacterium]|nr:CbtB-domain containing protein [Nitrospirota bacterium]